MRKYIRSSSENYPLLKEFLKELKARGIDTTKHKYELKAERYERFGSGDTYTYKFTALGDYVAYISMKIHRDMTKDGIEEFLEDYYGGVEETLDYIPTLDAMEATASDDWWGDGDDYIIYLKNLDTGKVLYEGDYEEEYEEDDDWDDED